MYFETHAFVACVGVYRTYTLFYKKVSYDLSIRLHARDEADERALMHALRPESWQCIRACA